MKKKPIARPWVIWRYEGSIKTKFASFKSEKACVRELKLLNRAAMGNHRYTFQYTFEPTALHFPA